MYLTPSQKRSKRRHDDWRKAIRKREICRHVYGWEWYDELHRYSKNKIHCSCAMCSAKTRNKSYSRRKSYLPAIAYNMRDQKRIDSMKYFDEE